MGEKVRIRVKTPEIKRDNPSKKQKPDFSQPTSSSIDHILFLQRTIGNQAVGRLMSKKQTPYQEVIQLQTDPTPPKEVLEERRKEERKEFAAATATTEEVGDTGGRGCRV